MSGVTTSTTTTSSVTTQPVTTSSSVTTQPVTTTTTTSTTVDEVAVALNKLSKTALQNLWDDNWTNQGFFGRITGIFTYLWNRSEAASKDTDEAVATIAKFNNATAELINAVALRGLTSEEADKLGVARVQFSNADKQEIHATQRLEAEAKLTAFYKAFKERVSPTQLNIAENSDQFGIFALGAQKAVQDAAKDIKSSLTNSATGNKTYTTPTLATKFETTLNGFNAKIFDDMVDSFASQDLANITPESFKQKRNIIKGFFSKNDTIEIEAKLRQAIQAKHDSQKLTELQAKYQGAATNTSDPLFVTSKEDKKATLEAKQTALRAELDEFRGNNGFNGTYNAAAEALRNAEAEATQKFTQLVGEFQRPAASVNENDRAAAIAVITAFIGAGAATTSSATSTVNVARLTTLLSEYQEKVAAVEEKKAALEVIKKRFDEIAVYNGPNLTGGELAQVDTNLGTNSLDLETTKELRNMAKFYGALKAIVNDANKRSLSVALNKIIGA